jgi:RNA polymerase sigma-70 factor, ECF subfamily
MRASRNDPAEAQPHAVTEAAFPAPFEQLFLEHWDRIYRLLVRMIGDPAEAEDLAMETFFRLYRNPPAPRPGSNIQGWLYRVATNLGLHSIRSYQRRQRYELAAGLEALPDPGIDQPQESLESRDTHRLVRRVLARMQPRQAQLLALRYSGRSYSEIAAAMQLAPASIGPLLLRSERSFEKLYRSFSREEV